MSPQDFSGPWFGALIQTGSFGVVVLILLWIMFRLGPSIKETIDKRDVIFAETIAKKDQVLKETVEVFGQTTATVMAENRAVIERLVTENRALLDTLSSRHENQVKEAAKECREERREWMETIKTEMENTRERMEKEGDLNRKSRHEFADKIQRMLTEVLKEGEERGEAKTRKEMENIR